jgi:predicted DCC family thiol-disulfide oxidoreductase YuxK
MTTAATVSTPVLLYDGECGFCAGSVQFVLAREPKERRGALQFAPIQGSFGATVRTRFPELDGVDSVIWFDPVTASVLVRSDAVLATLSHLGGAWRLLAALGRFVPRLLRDAVYARVARHRFELAARACLLPTPGERARFLA